MKLVGDDGTGNEPIIIIGEAPGAHEEAQGRPFVGPSGWKMNEWQAFAGLGRRDCYWTNVVPWRPPNNNIATVSPMDLAQCIDQLHGRLAQLQDPVVIVPTGNIALGALTGKKGITKHRGSIYCYEDRNGRQIKVIPTIHPAATFRTPGWERRCRRDWQRVAGDSQYRDLRLPHREHFTKPNRHDVESYVAEALQRAERLAVDIETPGGTITCVGFSWDPAFSITIPTTLSYWQSQEDLDYAWQAIKTLCESDIPKVTHNGHYDSFWMADRGIRLAAWLWDTLALHHAIDATEDHALAYCASVDTREPYWKDEAKDPEEAAKYASNLEAFWVYNGKDACVTAELADTYISRLQRDGRLDFYHDHYRRLFGPVLRMMRAGIRMDEAQRKRMHANLTHKSITLQEDLASLCGMPLHSTVRTKKQREAGKLPDLSSAKVRHYIFDVLKLPMIRKRGTGKPTADEVAVRQMMIRHGKKALKVSDEAAALGELVGEPLTFDAVGSRILEHRRTRKLMEFLDEGLLDEDGHMRYTFKFTTDTGRFACGKSPTMRRGQRTGRNVQNIDRELRGVFLPEPGCVFLEVDLSQAEDRIVKMLAAAVTGNESLRQRARAKPWENDEHKRAAASIFNVPIEAVSKPQRQMGKTARHACVDDKTEVLTGFGWMNVALAMDRGVEIAQWNPIGSHITFIKPSGWYKGQHVGRMLAFRSNAYNQLVTPDHKMPYVTNRKFKWSEAKDLPRSVTLPVAGYYEGDRAVPLVEARLYAAVQADGSINDKYSVEFHFRKERKIQRLKSLLTQYGATWKESEGKDGTTRIVTKSLRDIAITLGRGRQYGRFLLDWSGPSLDAWLNELHLWDGNLQAGPNHRREVYVNKHRQNCEWVKIIAHLRGRQSLVRYHSGVWIASLNRRQFCRGPRRTEHWYEGHVFCPTVPTGFFMIRRKGEVSVSGNTNYDMHGRTMSDNLLKEGVVETPEECDRMIGAIHAADPDIREWQKATRALVMTHRCLTNSWGRMLAWDYDRLSDDVYRQAYAFIPQSEVPAIVNQYGLIPLDREIIRNGWKTVVHLQGHDSLLMSCPPDEVWPVMSFLKGSLERPRTIGREPLTIWTEFSLGVTWKKDYEWKRPATEDEVRAALEKLGV